MGTQARVELAKLKKRYAHHFKVPLEDLATEEYRDDIYVFDPKRPELPQWSLGFND